MNSLREWRALIFETLFAAQMIGINKNNGILRVNLSFAEKNQFRSKKPFSQPLRNPFRSCELSVTVLRSGIHVSKSLSQLRNTLRNGTLVAKSGIFTLYCFAIHFAVANWGFLCCEEAHMCQTWLCSFQNFRRGENRATK